MPGETPGSPARIYALADELGLLVWVEVPSPHQSIPLGRVQHAVELQRLLRHIGAYPLVTLISQHNESWGAQKPGPTITINCVLDRGAGQRWQAPCPAWAHRPGWEGSGAPTPIGSPDTAPCPDSNVQCRQAYRTQAAQPVAFVARTCMAQGETQ